MKLQPHEVETGDAFGDRMLDLDARVHLQEMELAVLGEEELDRPRADIADCARGSHRRLAHAGAKLG